MATESNMNIIDTKDEGIVVKEIPISISDEKLRNSLSCAYEEWRMITGCIMKPPVMMEWIPSGIILGLRMGVAEENLVVSMAKEAGIKNIYKSYINAQNKLDAYPLKL